MPLGKILSTVAPFLQNAVQTGLSVWNTNKTIQANKELAEYQYKNDVEMWNRANQYNSPEAQMERIRKAGLNPNMVYGSGSVAGNTTGQIPKYQAPHVQYDYQMPDIATTLQQFQELRVKNAVIDNLKEQNKVIAQDAINKAMAYKLMVRDEDRKRLDNFILNETSQYMIDAKKQQAQNLLKDFDIKSVVEQQKLFDLNSLKPSQLKGQQLKNQYQTLMNEWAQKGLTPQDSVLWRVLTRMFKGSGIKKAGDFLKDADKNYMKMYQLTP